MQEITCYGLALVEMRESRKPEMYSTKEYCESGANKLVRFLI